MFDGAAFIWLLLPLGIALGWILSSRMRGNLPPPQATSSASWRPTGDTGAVTETDSGPAVGEVLDSLDRIGQADPDIYEMQLILGTSLRQRGAIDRAIGVHERLLAAAVQAEEAADIEERLRAGSRADAARFELARDFVQGGLMDRAERLLDELCQRGVMLAQALELLVSVHEQARNWEQASAAARRLQAIEGKDYRPLLAHYQCELAEQHRATDDVETARRCARSALEICGESVRGALLLGDLAQAAGDLPAAVRAWRKVPRQDVRYLPEVLPRLASAWEESGEPERYRAFIREAERDYPKALSVGLEQARLLALDNGESAAYLAQRLADNLHWAGLLAWFDARAGAAAEGSGEGQIREALRKRLEAVPRYHCSACGLEPNLLFWQCPGCKQWGTIAPNADRA